MRLINTKTFLLESIYTQVPYAILSHTWGPEEISFQEWEVVHDSGAIQGQCPHTQMVSRPNVTRKKGYEKVIGACQQAARDGIQYLWCDTNCIDKTSSAELSEAINSMFAWYRDSKVCYVILTDVQVPTATSLRGHKSYTEGWFIRQQKNKRQNVEVWEKFRASRWWTRGWTLQELLAPKFLVFFACDWSPLGNKVKLSEMILRFTTIHRLALQDASSIPSFSVAQRMSWAANRRTTVPEDMAYCLLGIFDINMPMLYGQGYKAFLKLQEEIIKVSDDHSILAWDNSDNEPKLTAGLAISPASFKNCGDLARGVYSKHSAYSVTNLGLSMRLETMTTTTPGVVLVGLDCCRVLYYPEDGIMLGNRLVPKEFRVWIPLQIAGRKGDNRWLRVHHPFSRTCLEHQFQLMGNTTYRELFISTSHNPDGTPLEELQGHQRPHRTIPSGIFLRFGFGEINSSMLFSKLFDFREFSTTTLRHRRHRDVSHKLVSSGPFSILISAAWDTDGNSNGFHHTIMDAPASKILTKTQNGDIWAILSNQEPFPTTRPESELSNKLYELHETLKRVFPVTHKYPKQFWPIVEASDEHFQDFQGNPEIAVRVIFRDPQPR